jgi:histidinol-phosphate aminotransferase
MRMGTSRREWLKQGTFAALGLGVSLHSLGNEEGLLRSFGKNEGLINLGSNENPYGISPRAREAILGMIGEANRYQFNVKELQNFKNELAEFYGVSPQHLLVTAGSGEGLNLLARYFTTGNIVTAKPTFGILPNTAKRLGIEVLEVPVTFEKVHDLGAMRKSVNNNTSLVYIVNPANPTGTIVGTKELKEFCEEVSKKTVVLVDEAYQEFIDISGKESMINLALNNPNILVIKTFSKIHAMAGLRVGFVIGHPSLIQKLQDQYFGNTQNCVSNLSMAAALASLKDKLHCQESRQKNDAARSYAFSELKNMGYRCHPSHTNFLFFNLGDHKGDFSQQMLAKKIVVRSSGYDDGQWCRVSIGTMDEMKTFCSTLESLKA